MIGPLFGHQVGDWTQELFRLSLEDPRIKMPIWITAAQPSVLEKSIFFDNGAFSAASTPKTTSPCLGCGAPCWGCSPPRAPPVAAACATAVSRTSRGAAEQGVRPLFTPAFPFALFFFTLPPLRPLFVLPARSCSTSPTPRVFRGLSQSFWCALELASPRPFLWRICESAVSVLTPCTAYRALLSLSVRGAWCLKSPLVLDSLQSRLHRGVRVRPWLEHPRAAFLSSHGNGSKTRGGNADLCMFCSSRCKGRAPH